VEQLYRVGQFAGLTGVSIRTLHHYDQVGLLRPTGRSEAGYRLYAERDLLRLQQVLTLRYLGFPLGRIRELLERPELDLVASLRVQRRALRDRVAEIQRIASALEALLERRLATGEWAWDLAGQAAAAAQAGLAENGNSMERYYTPEQLKQFAELRDEVPEEERRAVEAGWTALLAEVRANRGLDPASPKARELADCWDGLMERTMAGFQSKPGLWEAIGENYRQGNFDGFEGAAQKEDFDFIARVKEARGG
jgi:DNA-binding transcriptional MerR regulator